MSAAPRSGGAGLWLCLAWLCAARALAQAPLEHYQPAPMSNDGFAAPRPVVPEAGAADVQVQLSYADGPRTGGASVVERMLVDHLIAAFGVADGWALYARLPVVLLLSEADPGQPRGSERGGLGDAAVGARLRLTSPRAPFGLAVALAARAPTARLSRAGQRWLGDRFGSVEAQLVSGLRGPRWDLYASLGGRFRARARVDGRRVGQALSWAAGGRVRLASGLRAYLESFGSAGFRQHQNPAELLAGLRYQVGGSMIGAAGGVGLGSDRGAPRWRAVLQIGFEPGVEPPPEMWARERRWRRQARARERRVRRGPSARVERPRVVQLADPDSDQDGVPDPQDECPAEAEDRDDYQDEDGCPDPNDDGDSVGDSLDLCPHQAEDEDGFEDEDGCPDPDNDRDGVLDGADRCRAEPGDAPDGCPQRQATVDAQGGTIELTRPIDFASGQDRILGSSAALLDEIGALLRENPQVRRVRIVGHSDQRGPSAANMALSRRRAASVARGLIERGVAAGRIEAYGCGELNLVDPRDTPRAHRDNRRVVLEIVGSDEAKTSLVRGCQRVSP